MATGAAFNGKPNVIDFKTVESDTQSSPVVTLTTTTNTYESFHGDPKRRHAADAQRAGLVSDHDTLRRHIGNSRRASDSGGCNVPGMLGASATTIKETMSRIDPVLGTAEQRTAVTYLVPLYGEACFVLGDQLPTTTITAVNRHTCSPPRRSRSRRRRKPSASKAARLPGQASAAVPRRSAPPPWPLQRRRTSRLRWDAQRSDVLLSASINSVVKSCTRFLATPPLSSG